MSGWMITVDTYNFVYLAFCVFTENNKLHFIFLKNCLTIYFKADAIVFPIILLP